MERFARNNPDKRYSRHNCSPAILDRLKKELHKLSKYYYSNINRIQNSVHSDGFSLVTINIYISDNIYKRNYNSGCFQIGRLIPNQLYY